MVGSMACADVTPAPPLWHMLLRPPASVARVVKGSLHHTTFQLPVGNPTHLSLDLLEHLSDLLILVHLPDTLATTTPAGLEHDWIADAVAALDGLLWCPHTGLQQHNSPVKNARKEAQQGKIGTGTHVSCTDDGHAHGRQQSASMQSSRHACTNLQGPAHMHQHSRAACQEAAGQGHHTHVPRLIFPAGSGSCLRRCTKHVSCFDCADLVVDVCWDVTMALLKAHCHARARPWQGGHASSLGQNGGANLHHAEQAGQCRMTCRLVRQTKGGVEAAASRFPADVTRTCLHASCMRHTIAC
jgi:hypothetical protein